MLIGGMAGASSTPLRDREGKADAQQRRRTAPAIPMDAGADSFSGSSKRVTEMKLIGLALTGLFSLAYAGSVDPAEYPDPEAAVTIIATDTLRDVAVAVYDRQHPMIYVNPTRMQRFGQQLADFFLAHEFGHIHYHHTRANALTADRQRRDALMQSRELEADCYAAATLGRSDRRAVLEAARFFGQMGPYRFDREHPSGSQRAARILACLPAEPSTSE